MSGALTRRRVLPARRARAQAHSPSVVAGEVLSLLQQWYTSSMNVVCTWLTDRMDLQLHIYQLKTLIRIVKVISTSGFNTPCCQKESVCMPACVQHGLLVNYH